MTSNNHRPTDTDHNEECDPVKLYKLLVLFIKYEPSSISDRFDDDNDNVKHSIDLIRAQYQLNVVNLSLIHI